MGGAGGASWRISGRLKWRLEAIKMESRGGSRGSSVRGRVTAYKPLFLHLHVLKMRSAQRQTIKQPRGGWFLQAQPESNFF